VKAIGRIRVHENARVLVAKETLKQSASDLVRAEVVNVAGLQAVANECSGLMETGIVWNHEKVLKVFLFFHNKSCQLGTATL